MALSKVDRLPVARLSPSTGAKNSILLELDSAEKARLPSEAQGDDKHARFRELPGGMELRVLVIETKDGRFGTPFHTVSERLDEVVDIDEDAAPAAAANRTRR